MASIAQPRRRRVDRRKVLLVALVASGYVAALVLGLLLAEAQAHAWDEDAVLLGDYARSFNGTARALRAFANTNEFAWANESVRWLQLAANIADADFFRHAVPSANAVGLTFPTLYCGIYALNRVVVEIVANLSGPPHLNYLHQVEPIYRNLAIDLDVVRPFGTDPLGQLGPNRVASIRTGLGQIRSLSDSWYLNGPCPT